MADRLGLAGQNIVVLDLETARSADDCRHCGYGADVHSVISSACTRYERLGWNDPTALGLSIGCLYDYQDSWLSWFDVHTLAATMAWLVDRQPLMVTFNGLQFDFVLMRGLVRQDAGQPFHDPATLRALCADFQDLCARSYDLLAQIWQADPERKFEKGLTGLDAISQANGFGAKEMDGATAPVLWRQGQYARVLTYCAGDVRKTKALFELVLDTGQLLRGDGRPLVLPLPVLPADSSTPMC
jgi:hypothetical protein